MRIKSFSDPAAEKGDGYSRRYYLTLTDGEQVKRALPDCSPYSGHFRIRGRGASADQWVSAIKVPVHEEPNQIINDGEKHGWVDRAEPHRIRINGSAGADQCLAQARNKLRARRRSWNGYRMKCRSLKHNVQRTTSPPCCGCATTVSKPSKQ